MDIQGLVRISGSALDFVPSENNVKYKIVIPLLACFGHDQLDLEHAAQGSRIDINIGNKIIVETKALGENLDNHIQQISDYCGREWPVLAILTNGRDYKIYSPQWRQMSKFPEKIIYSFCLQDLKNQQLIERLDLILGIDNYKSGDFFDFVEKREKEIIRVKKEIDIARQAAEKEIEQIRSEIAALSTRLEAIKEQKSQKEQDLENRRLNTPPDVQSLIEEFLLPVDAQLGKAVKRPKTAMPTEPFKASGHMRVINNPKRGVLARGYLLNDGRFVVLQGSTISQITAPKFESSSAAAYRLRNQYIKDGTINSIRQFSRDVRFNTISLAASVIMGDSKNGKLTWTAEIPD